LNSIVGQAVNAAMENALYAPPAPPELGVVVGRVFPDGTAKGELQPITSMMEVTINGNVYPRAPGMLIRNQQNLIVMQNTIQSNAPVRYQVDGSGAVFRVWLLTQAEIAAK
jgi:hypothetical protein